MTPHETPHEDADAAARRAPQSRSQRRSQSRSQSRSGVRSGDRPRELSDGTVVLEARPSADEHDVEFAVLREDEEVGRVRVQRTEDGAGRLSWELRWGHRGRGSATRAVRLLADWAMTETGQGGLGVGRVEALVPADNQPALRVATRAGLRREGVSRTAPPTQEGAPEELVLLARLNTDPPLSDPSSFRALLNSFLPRKRAIAQMLVRDTRDRVLLCQLTYKQDWDLPGGVVEVGESPQLAVGREVAEELAVEIAPRTLLLTDWLPPWGGWDDAVCLVFDGGRHDPSLVDRMVHEEREIRDARFLAMEEVERRAADFTARRIRAALAALRGEGPPYTESGR